MALCKLEGEIILSSATAVGTFAGFAITMPAGQYFLNSIGTGVSRSFLDELKNQLDTTTGRLWVFTLDDTNDTSTGKLTITVSGGATTATWTSTTIRDLLGFTTNLASSTSWQGANQCKYLFLPNCNRTDVAAPDASGGAIESNHFQAISTDGTLYNWASAKRYYDTLAFGTLLGSKTWNCFATTTNGALEQFYGDVIGLGSRVRFHADRSIDATYRTWRVEDANHFDPRQYRQNHVGANALFAINYRVRETT